MVGWMVLDREVTFSRPRALTFSRRFVPPVSILVLVHLVALTTYHEASLNRENLEETRGRAPRTFFVA